MKSKNDEFEKEIKKCYIEIWKVHIYCTVEEKTLLELIVETEKKAIKEKNDFLEEYGTGKEELEYSIYSEKNFTEDRIRKLLKDYKSQILKDNPLAGLSDEQKKYIATLVWREERKYIRKKESHEIETNIVSIFQKELKKRKDKY